MRAIDEYSYQCGVMDCFCEMVRAGVKRLALSHPMETKVKRDAFLDYAKELCEKYGVQYYPEDDGLITDLFPVSMNRGKHNILSVSYTHLIITAISRISLMNWSRNSMRRRAQSRGSLFRRTARAL